MQKIYPKSVKILKCDEGDDQDENDDDNDDDGDDIAQLASTIYFNRSNQW